MIIETWESICDQVEAIIKDGQASYERRWFSSETFLKYLDIPILDPIDEAMPPKLKLEKIKNDFSKVKDPILEMTQLTMDEIKKLIETTVASLMIINSFLKEWTKIKKKEIDSLICKTKFHIKNDQFKDIQGLMDAFSKWFSPLGKS